ncbi:hypothetical protein [Clostridium felsineum]|uniref:Uncharacterized protein n=1 Tax=Clostridium felsineum TaxID=36839 RepID=A0A1S8LFV9_9CLOT|nr:hypothetical protein [Clostridium felsineum]MCR3761436.1 hypothetical protein [Clostridium felsineum]URZ06732.1 hypothetical protein CLROS_020650 [Clostridium felsineum]URZ11765.1 hypothetical protein CROST_024820 [Clostridium felsineum]URZ16326.1 hypothetical protein CLFE_023730 [Clostridium felsineum DSM 794]
MKKYKIFNRIITIALLLIVTLCAFCGCSNNSSSNTENTTKKVVDKDNIKKTYNTGLKDLEKSSAITKEQSAAVLTALMDNVTKATGKPKDALDKLVKDKVITQDQENKIIDALKIK